MKHLLSAAVAALTLSIAPAVQAHEIEAGDLQIIHPSIPQPLTRSMSAAGYMVISNDGDTDERLLAIEVPIATSAQIHTTIHGTDGVARMEHVEALDIPAGDVVKLERGGHHVMLIGLSKGLVEGDMVEATLVFERAGRVAVEFMVDPARGAHGSDGGHKH